MRKKKWYTNFSRVNVYKPFTFTVPAVETIITILSFHSENKHVNKTLQ